MSVPADLSTQFEYIQKKIQKRLDIYDEKERWCWWYTVILRVFGFALSAAITVVAGWGGVDFALQKNAVLMLGAASTLLASIAAFWNIERYWLENRVIFEGLRGLRDRINYVLNRHSPVTDAELQAIWTDYERLMARRADYWTNQLHAGKSAQRPAAKQVQPGTQAKRPAANRTSTTTTPITGSKPLAPSQ